MTPDPSHLIAVLKSQLFREHFAPETHPECPERLEAAEAGLSDALARLSDWSVLPMAMRAATREELSAVHHRDYLDALQAIRGHEGFLDSDTFFSSGSLDAAEHAAGGAISLADALLTRQAAFAVGLVRPPGHHATIERAMGFCLLNNIAVAAAHALNAGAQRVFIFDWDVHHGNGTQDIFYDRSDVLFCSIHQAPWYPGTGNVADSGRGAGRGFTVNVPLSNGAGDAAYFAVFERLIAPILGQYRPDLVLVSAGYDAHRRDPLGQMRVSSAGFGELARRLAIASASDAATPIGLLLEGGYDLLALRESVAASVVGLTSGYINPNEPALGAPDPIVASHERDIDRALSQQRQFWDL